MNKLIKENTVKNIKKGVRHGEVALIPTNGKVSGKQSKNYIVGHSETGHNHVIESEAPFTVDEKKMYLELLSPAKLVHKKSFDAHKTLTLAPGTYKRYEMVEYDVASAVVRRVID